MLTSIQHLYEQEKKIEMSESPDELQNINLRLNRIEQELASNSLKVT